MSQEKIFNLRAMGAEVVLTRSDVEKGHPEYYQDLGARLAREHGAYFHINQFGNPDNPKAHATTTGPGDPRADGGPARRDRGRHRLERHDRGPHAVLRASGAVGRDHPRRSRGLGARGLGATRASYGKAGSWLVEGIGEDFIPDICDFSMCRKAYSIRDGESFAVAREILLKEGLLVGSSTGTLVAAALR